MNNVSTPIGRFRRMGLWCATWVVVCATWLSAQVRTATEPTGDQRDTSSAPTTNQTATDSTTSAPANSDSPEVRRLLEGKGDEGDVAKETLAAMTEAADRLERHGAADDRTLAVQGRVLTGLDRMIEDARQSKSGGNSRSKGQGATRRKAPGEPPPPGSGAAKSESAARSAASQPAGSPKNPPVPGHAKKPDRAGKAELQRGWGYLPQRERDQIIQGFDDEFMSKYEAEILDYYKRLAREGAEE